jgi:hypothetical protein
LLYIRTLPTFTCHNAHHLSRSSATENVFSISSGSKKKDMRVSIHNVVERKKLSDKHLFFAGEKVLRKSARRMQNVRVAFYHFPP